VLGPENGAAFSIDFGRLLVRIWVVPIQWRSLRIQLRVLRQIFSMQLADLCFASPCSKPECGSTCHILTRLPSLHGQHLLIFITSLPFHLHVVPSSAIAIPMQRHGDPSPHWRVSVGRSIFALVPSPEEQSPSPPERSVSSSRCRAGPRVLKSHCQFPTPETLRN
jgi:hypothetical protein